MPQIDKETVCFTNMCMVIDKDKNVVALDKKKGGYTGLTFPGGHLEEGEVFYDAVIREVKEESGLDIMSPRFCGIYHWKKAGIHNIIFLYRAENFSGELKDSEEGPVFWAPLEEFKKMDLAVGMEHVIKICEESGAQECFMKEEGEGYREFLF